MNWRNQLTDQEHSQLNRLEDRRDYLRDEIGVLSDAIARIRNTCVNRQRRAKP